MRHFAIAIAMLAIPAATALPAAAQDLSPRDWSDWNTQGQRATRFVDGLEWQINYAERSGRISADRADWLRQREYEAKPIAWRVEMGTASWEDRQQLNRDVDDIENSLTRNYHTYRGYQRDDGWGGDDWPR